MMQRIKIKMKYMSLTKSDYHSLVVLFNHVNPSLTLLSFSISYSILTSLLPSSQTVIILIFSMCDWDTQPFLLQWWWWSRSCHRYFSLRDRSIIIIDMISFLFLNPRREIGSDDWLKSKWVKKRNTRIGRSIQCVVHSRKKRRQEVDSFHVLCLPKRVCLDSMTQTCHHKKRKRWRRCWEPVKWQLQF